MQFPPSREEEVQRSGLQQQENEQVLIKFDGPLCKANTVVSFSNYNRLEGSARFGANNRTIVFNKSGANNVPSKLSR